MNRTSSNHLSWTCDFHTSTELYAGRFAGRAGEIILKRQSELLERFMGDIKGKKILDVGAGHGQSAETVCSRGGELTAYGSSEGSFSQLRKAIKEKGYNIKSVVGGLDKLPFENESFDVVISLRIISHVPDWVSFLGELCRVAKDSVIFDFAPQNPGFLKMLSFFLKSRTETASREFTTQGISEIRDAADKNSFVLRDYERQFIIPIVIHRMLKGACLLPVERFARAAHLTRFIGGPVLAQLKRERR